MTSDELAVYVESYVRECVAGILGVGREQYESAEGQKFELISDVALIDMFREELRDISAYACMADIKLQRLRARLIEIESR